MSLLTNYFWVFVLGSFIGWLCESVWCILRYRKIESRKGLIYGYFIPIYGIATLFISLFVNVFNINNYWLFFFLTFLICGVVEYLSSIFQEECFETKSWDYSEMFLNINGRVNILYLSIWSIMGIFWCKYSKMMLNFLFGLLIKIDLLYEITIISLIFMLYDLFISFVSVYRWKLRRKGIKARNRYELWLDKKYNDEKLKKIYANSVVI